jgi:hypothetical protein
MDEATKVSIEALKRIREEEAEKNTRHRKLKCEKVERTEGAALLEDVLEFLSRFIAYPSDHALIAHVLWIAHTHLMTAWESTPRLAFLSPEPASGKTRSMEVTELLVPKAVAAVNVTPAYLFRKVGGEDGPPTILFDEIDTVFGPKAKEHEEIRALLNSGHRRGAVAGRCLVRGKIVETEEISSYAAVALAGLGWLPDTILSRSIIIRMRRRAPDETIEAFRRRVHAPQGEALCRRLAGWAATILDEATEARPDMPAGVEDRNADMWEPLLAAADIAGGSWPGRARAVAVALVAVAREVEPSLNIRLLTDVRTVFGDEEQLPTKKILAELCLIEDAPWNDLKGNPITNNQLARRLRQYGVKPKTLRLADDRFAKDYARADLHDVWRRYLAPLPDKAVTAVTPVTHPVSCRLDVTPVPGRGSNVTPPEPNRVTPVTAPLAACDALADQRNPHEMPVVTPVTPVTALSGNGRTARPKSGVPAMASDDGDEPGLSRSRDDFGAIPVPKHRCDHCGSATGITYPYDWPGRPDGIWLHRQCEAPWFDSAGAPLVCDSPDEIARVHIARCEAGDMQAIKDLADRLDGRPAPVLEHSGPDSEPIRKIVREIVHVTQTPEDIAAEDEVIEWRAVREAGRRPQSGGMGKSTNGELNEHGVDKTTRTP